MARDRSNRVIALVTVCVFSAALIPQNSSAGGGGGGGAVSPSASIVGDSSSVSEICTVVQRRHTQVPCLNQATSLHCPHSSSHLPSDSTQRAYSTSSFSPGPSDACNAHPPRGVASRHETILTSTPTLTHPPPSLFPRPSARQHCKPAHVSLGRHLVCLQWPYLSC
jgi:hypothetical protein